MRRQVWLALGCSSMGAWLTVEFAGEECKPGLTRWPVGVSTNSVCRYGGREEDGGIQPNEGLKVVSDWKRWRGSLVFLPCVSWCCETGWLDRLSWCLVIWNWAFRRRKGPLAAIARWRVAGAVELADFGRAFCVFLLCVSSLH